MKYLFPVSIIIILLLGVSAWTLTAQQGVIELEKSDALVLLNAQNSVVAAQANRNLILNRILIKYGAALDTHEVNVLAGQLIPIVQLEEVEESLETLGAN